MDYQISDYFWHSNKIISSGAFSTSYLGEDKKSGLKVIILKTDIKYEEQIRFEKYILNKIKGFGNFPPLYDTLVDDENIYLIEGFMGFDLHTLFKICDHDFNIITTINIGIELLDNIKILHDRGFLHRDLKPDNIVFGPMCEENIKYKNNIGIIDFGNSKLLMKKNGSINYTTKIYECRGTRTFASNNALQDIDTKKIDDIESIFYIMIYFFRGGILPWGKKYNQGLTKKDIVKIRKSIEPSTL